MAKIKAVLVDESDIVINVGVFDDRRPLPDGWVQADNPVAPGWTDNGDGTFSPPVEAPAPTTPEQDRDNSLGAISYDLGDGRIMLLREAHAQRMRAQIRRLTRLGSGQTRWPMADGTNQNVNLAELEAAQDYWYDESETIWDTYFDAVDD